MPATLTKIVDGKPAVNDTLENEQFVKCPSCDQVYRLAYSDSEWNRVKDWLSITELVRALDFANVVAELLSKAADSKPISEKSQPMRQFRRLFYANWSINAW